MRNVEIHSCPELMDLIQEVGFLPLLDSGIRGYSAEELVDEDNRYVVFDDGGWDWPLWKWKGPIVTEGRCVYGKFFAGKAGFVSKEWWPDLCNYRRASRPAPAEGSIEESILLTLAEHDSLITRELRAACGFDGPKMRWLRDTPADGLSYCDGGLCISYRQAWARIRMGLVAVDNTRVAFGT